MSPTGPTLLADPELFKRGHILYCCLGKNISLVSGYPTDPNILGAYSNFLSLLGD